MSFSWPWALLALLVIPLVFATWWLTRLRRRRAVVRVTSIALVRTAMPGRSRWRRRIPVALLTLGLAVLAVGAARPQATVPVPSSSATIMLALDVSGSMCSTDVQPNRITAAEQAAAAFIKSQAGGPRSGLVAFPRTPGGLVPRGHGAVDQRAQRPHHLIRHRHRRGHSDLARRHCPGRPVGPADRRDRLPRPPRRLCRRRDRRAHRRLEQPGGRPAGRGQG